MQLPKRFKVKLHYPQSALCNRSGMTLVEILVVIIIAAVVVLIIYGAVDTTFRLGKKGLSEVERLEEARLVMDYITRDISGAVSFAKDTQGEVIFQGRKGDIVGLDCDSLSLVVGNSKTQVDGKPVITFERITYTVETSPVEKDFESRIYREVNQIADVQTDTTKMVQGLGIGIPKVKYGLRLRYWDDQLSTSPGWVEEWMNRSSLPKQVMIIVTVKHSNEPNGILKLSTVVKVMGG